MLRKTQFVSVKLTIFFFIATVIFIFSFQTNKISFFSNHKWFVTHQADSDDLIYKSVVRTFLGETSLFSSLDSQDRRVKIGAYATKDQYDQYVTNIQLTPSENYKSSFGLQKTLIYPAYHIASLITNHSLSNFLCKMGKCVAFLVVIANALCFGLIARWLASEFDVIVGGIFIALTCMLSGWVTVFAHSIYWMMWSWYLPFLFSAYYLQINRKISWHFLSGITLLICFKSLMGYEYISSIAISSAIPICFYGIVDERRYILILRDIGYIGLACIIGIFIAFFIHAVQLSLENQSSLWDGFKYIYAVASKRTHVILGFDGPQVYLNSMKKSLFFVLTTYLFSKNCMQYLWIMLLSGLTYLYLNSKLLLIEQEQSKVKALLISTWLSSIAPISWYALAKGHSVIHTHMNFVLWWLPLNLLIIMTMSVVIKRYCIATFVKKKHTRVMAN